MEGDRLSVRRFVRQIVFPYAFVSSLWIGFTDVLLRLSIDNVYLLTRLQTVKGWGFVFVTSLLLYHLLKKNLRSLEEISNLVQAILQGTTEAIYIKDLEGRYLAINAAGAKRLGKTIKEAIGKTDAELLPPELAQTIRENDLATIATGRSQTFEEQYNLDPPIRINLATKDVYRDGQGNIIGAIGISCDITERQQMREALVERERFLSTLIGNLPGLVYRCYPDSRYTFEFGSVGCLALTGYRPEEFGKNGRVAYADIVHPDDRQQLRLEVEAALLARSLFTSTYRIITASGEEKWVWDRGIGIYTEAGVAIAIEGFITDVSAAKYLEAERTSLLEALTREKEDLFALSTITANGIGTLNLEELLDVLLQRIVEVMHADRATILLKKGDYLAVTNSIGLEAEVEENYQIPIGQGFAGAIASTLQPLYLKDAQNSSQILSPFIQQSGIRSILGVPLHHQDRLVGVLHVAWLQIHPMSDRELHLLEVVAERCTMAILNSQLYETTKQLQERLQLQFDCMPIICILRDLDLHVIDCNPATEKTFGYTRTEIIGQTSDRYIAPNAKNQVRENFQRVLEGETIQDTNQNLTKQGEILVCEWINTPLKQADGTIVGMMSMGQDITQRVRAEAALRESEQRYRELFESNPHPMWFFDTETLEFLAVNNAAIAHYGYSREEFLSMTLRDIRPPEDIPALESIGPNIGLTKIGIWRHRKKDGTVISVEITVHSVDFAGRKAQVALVNDITERLQVEAALRQSEEQLRSVLENMPVMLDAFDDRGNLIVWNQECERVTGYSAQEIVGNPQAMELLYPASTYREQLFAAWRDRASDYRNFEWQVTCKDGSIKAIAWSNISQHFPIPGWATWAIGVDITARKQVEEQLRSYAYYDQLTKLPNRALFIEQLQQRIERAARGDESLFAVLFLDLDRFGMVKYSLGHAVADQLLLTTAHRLTQCLSANNTVARIGTDEFAILLANAGDDSEVTRIAETIHQALSLPFNLDGNEVFSTISLGIALSTTGYTQAEDFLRAADSAMYQAKESRSSRQVLFDPVIHKTMLARLQMETELRRAIEQNGLQVYYQPIVGLDDGKIKGFEALVRWNHPTRGMISPVDFIPLAEETGLISAIDRWVLQQACRQLAIWQQEIPALSHLTMSVNLSGQQLSQVGLLERLDQILQETGINGRNLKLEITESAIMDNTATEMALLEQLRTLGIQLSIDDFGTGYSSLGRLHQLPIDTLKIDRSFVNRMEADGDGLEIVRAILTLAHSLNMDAIAEGVETPEQLAQLRKLSCEYGQGYFFSRPVDSEKARELLAADLQW